MRRRPALLIMLLVAWLSGPLAAAQAEGGGPGERGNSLLASSGALGTLGGLPALRAREAVRLLNRVPAAGWGRPRQPLAPSPRWLQVGYAAVEALARLQLGAAGREPHVAVEETVATLLRLRELLSGQREAAEVEVVISNLRAGSGSPGATGAARTALLGIYAGLYGRLGRAQDDSLDALLLGESVGVLAVAAAAQDQALARDALAVLPSQLESLPAGVWLPGEVTQALNRAGALAGAERQAPFTAAEFALMRQAAEAAYGAMRG